MISMGTCKYCGQPTGLLSLYHKECKQRHSQGCDALKRDLNKFLNGEILPKSLTESLKLYQQPDYLNKDDLKEIALAEFEDFENMMKPPYPASLLQRITDVGAILGLRYDEMNGKGTLSRIAQKLIRAFCIEYFLGRLELDKLDSRTQKILLALPLTQQELEEARLHTLGKAATKFLQDGILSSEEEQLFNGFVNHYSLPINNLPVKYKGSDIPKVSQASLLRQLQQGIVPRTNLSIPVLLGTKENALSIFSGVKCLEEKTQRITRGRMGGLSFRVCKGVYYRTGSFGGKPIERSFLQTIGTGELIITNLNLIFYSTTRSIKISLKKIIAFTPYSDGIEIHKDGSSKRIIFQGFDPWLLVNVFSLLSI